MIEIYERCIHCKSPLIAFHWNSVYWIKTCQTSGCESLNRPLGAYKCDVCGASNGELNIKNGICASCLALAKKTA